MPSALCDKNKGVTGVRCEWFVRVSRGAHGPVLFGLFQSLPFQRHGAINSITACMITLGGTGNLNCQEVILLSLVGASTSEPHSQELNSKSVTRDIYIYIYMYRIQTDARVITGNTTEIKNRGRRPRFFISRLYFP